MSLFVSMMKNKYNKDNQEYFDKIRDFDCSFTVLLLLLELCSLCIVMLFNAQHCILIIAINPLEYFSNHIKNQNVIFGDFSF